MARYTCAFTVVGSFEYLRQLLVEVLQSFGLNVIYDTGDYLMAREIQGQVSFSKLVTVEVLIDRTSATETETRMELVIKNEELPLQVENHCYQIFQLVNQAIIDNRDWQLIESVAG